MKKILTILALVMLCSLSFGASKVFTGPGDFLDNTKWDGSALPAAGDSLSIGTGNCTMSASASSVYGTLVVQSSISLDLGTCSLSVGAASIGGTLKVGHSGGSGFTCAGLLAGSTSLDLQTDSLLSNSGNLTLSAGAFTSYLGSYTQTGNGTYSNPTAWYSYASSPGVVVTAGANSKFTGIGSANTTLAGSVAMNGFDIYYGGTGSLEIGTDFDVVGANKVFTSFPTVTVVNYKTGALSLTGKLAPIGELASTTMVPAIDISNASLATSCNGTGTTCTFEFTPGTLKCIDFTFNDFSGASNAVIDASNGNPSFVVTGSWLTTTTGVAVTWNKGTGSITFSGAGAKTVDFGSLNPATEALVIAASGATISVAHNFQPLSISGTAGTLQSNTAGVRRTLNATNVGTCSGMTFKDISTGTWRKIMAKVSCVNRGNNFGIVFKDKIRD
jgi:hypothetical protein